MSVLFIALLHAVAVLFIAIWTVSRVAVVLAAVASGWIGVATGNPAYAAVDLIGVAVAFAVSISFINKTNFINKTKSSAAPQKETPAPIAPPTPRAAPAAPAPEKEEDWSWAFIGAISGFGAILFFFFKATETPVAPPVPPPAQVQQPVSVPLKQPVMPTRTRKHRNNSDLRHCLNLPTKAEIIRCANQGQ